jgi:hypothetical protein
MWRKEDAEVSGCGQAEGRGGGAGVRVTRRAVEIAGRTQKSQGVCEAVTRRTEMRDERREQGGGADADAVGRGAAGDVAGGAIRVVDDVRGVSEEDPFSGVEYFGAVAAFAEGKSMGRKRRKAAATRA